MIRDHFKIITLIITACQMLDIKTKHSHGLLIHIRPKLIYNLCCPFIHHYNTAYNFMLISPRIIVRERERGEDHNGHLEFRDHVRGSQYFDIRVSYNRFLLCMEATPNRTFLCMEATPNKTY